MACARDVSMLMVDGETNRRVDDYDDRLTTDISRHEPREYQDMAHAACGIGGDRCGQTTRPTWDYHRAKKRKPADRNARNVPRSLTVGNFHSGIVPSAASSTMTGATESHAVGR